MDIMLVYRTLSSHINNENLIFCSEAIGVGGNALDEFLTGTFGSRKLQLNEVNVKLYKDIISIDSKTTLEGQMAGFDVELKVLAEDLYLRITVKMSEAYDVDFSGLKSFFADNVTKEYCFFLQDYRLADYGITGDIQDLLTVQDVLKLAVPKFQSPFENVTLKNISLLCKKRYQLGSYNTIAGIRSTSQMEITKDILIEQLGVEITIRKQAFELALSGTIVVDGTAIPLILRAKQGGFLFGLDTGENGVMLPSLNSIARFAGGDLAVVLPDGFSSLGGLCLKSLMLTLGEGFAFRRFTARIETTSQWEFLGIKGLSLSDVVLDLSAEEVKNQISFGGSIEGVINIGRFAVYLYAKRDAGGHYVLRGGMPRNKGINLTGLIKDFCVMLKISVITLPIPEIILSNVLFTFETDKKTFGAYISVDISNNEKHESIAGQLFKVNASIDVTSAVREGQRKLSGKFEGRLTIDGQLFLVMYEFGSQYSDCVSAGWKWKETGTSPLSLVNLVKAFGVDRVPDVLEELDISCDEIDLVYYISRKELEFKIVSTKYGSFVFCVREEQDGSIQFMTEITFISRIKLSKLPVVGTSLHLLDDISINELEVEAATSDIWPNVQKGVRIKGELLFYEKEETFELEIGGQKINQLSEPVGQKINSLPETEGQGFTKWIELNKSLSLFHFQRLGLNYQDGSVGFLLDASLSANPIEIGFTGLGVGFGMSDITDISFYLSGLSISYKNPSLSISGAFEEDGEHNYSGMLSVQMKSISMVGIGSYGEDSLFAYAVLNLPLGGPPAFFITGFAAGFGYNRDFEIPEIENVNTSPFVKAAFGKLSPAEMLSDMKKMCTVSKGNNFITAGIKFTSFKMVDSFALATVIFGRRLEVALLGFAVIDIPKGTGDTATPVAHAQLAIRAIYAPDEGYLSVRAQLTSESYILSKDCKITGGFAFCLWFDGEHKGDFVITLGGYHKAYKKPAHYPDVPRLGFSWDVTRELKISGGIYFALTPGCIMAGGSLSAVFHSGELRAWFEARADFMISWKPYYYDINLYIGLGVSYRLNLLFCKVTLKAELSAELQLWGPEFSGKARITWFIISFTISFIKSDRTKKYIDWVQFEESFLPHTQPQSADGSRDGDRIVGGVIEIASGKQSENEDGEVVVDPEILVVDFKTTVPCTQIKVNGLDIYAETKELGVLPMGCGKKLTSNCVIRFYGVKRTAALDKAAVIYENIPAALWGINENLEEELIKDAAMGVKLSPKHTDSSVTLPASYFLDLNQLIEYDKISKKFRWTVPATTAGPSYHGERSITRFSETAMKEDVKNKRKSMIEDFNKAGGYQLDTNINIETFARHAQEMIYEPMLLESVV